MTQPRKEQIKNLKTKYVRFNSVGNLSLSGGPTQNIINTSIESYYDNFLSSTKTGVVGGAETSSPAMLYGGSGPFSITAGNQFSITLPGVNSGSGVVVTIQSSDVVILGGSPVVTTSRLVTRINATLSVAGVPVPVASNIDGQVILTSANTSGFTYGDSSSIELSDVTPGIITILGFGITLSNGSTAPKRGMITESNDGLGGYLQLRKTDGTIPESINLCMRHIGDSKFLPDTYPAQNLFARMRAFPGPVLNGRKVQIDYFRYGNIKPSVITNNSDFSSITSGETINFTADFGNDITASWVLTFPTVTTVQAVINAFNSAYGSISSVSPITASFTLQIPGPYYFDNDDSFFISLNNQTPIHITSLSSVTSSNDFVTLINAAITAAGQTAEGSAILTSNNIGNTITIQSLNTDINVASVSFLPGRPSGSVPGTYMKTLNSLGIVPGVYKPSFVASLYGNDEILISLPSSLLNASLIMTGSLSTMSKLGLPSSVTLTTSQGIEKAVSPTVQALIPEVIEFSEEPDNYDSNIQTFDAKSDKSQADPVDGIKNNGVSSILDSFGKVNESFMPMIMSVLGIGSLRVGAGNAADSSQVLKPKIQVPQNVSLGLVLLTENKPDDLTTIPITRVYSGNGKIIITVNAKVASDSITWSRDNTSLDSTLFEITQEGRINVGYQDTDTWPDSSWAKKAKIKTKFIPNSTDDGEGVIDLASMSQMGAFFLDPTSRIEPQIRSNLSLYQNLIYVAHYRNGGEKFRIYIRADLPLLTEQSLYITINAYITPSDNWKSDDPTVGSSALVWNNFGVSLVGKNPTASQWISWDNIYLSLSSATYPFDSILGGSFEIGSALTTQNVPRLKMSRPDAAVSLGRRVLAFESPATGSETLVPIRMYAESKNSSTGEGFTFTYNARWEQSVDRWIQDNPSYKSFAWSMVDSSFYLLTKNSFSTNWFDGPYDWDTFDKLQSGEGFTTKDGIFRVDNPTSFFSNPFYSSPTFINSLYAKSMVKSWGKLGGTSTAGVFNIYDGFNLAGTTYDGANGNAKLLFATSIIAPYCVLGGAMQGINDAGYTVDLPDNSLPPLYRVISMMYTCGASNSGFWFKMLVKNSGGVWMTSDYLTGFHYAVIGQQ